MNVILILFFESQKHFVTMYWSNSDKKKFFLKIQEIFIFLCVLDPGDHLNFKKFCKKCWRQASGRQNFNLGKNWAISRTLFYLQTSNLVPRYNPIRRNLWHRCRWPWPLVKVKWPKSKKSAISQKLFYIQTSYLVPRYTPIRGISWPIWRWPWPKVKVTGQGQMSKKWPKSKISAISRKLFYLQTAYLVPRYTPIRGISWPIWRWPWPKVKVKGQGQMSKNWPKSKKSAISRTLFYLQTSYLVPRYTSIRGISWPMWRWPWPKVKVTGQGQM